LRVRNVGAAALLSCAAACSHAPTSPSAPLGSPFRIGVGQSVRIESAGFEIGFEQVLEDSRCPADALCVWPGTARLKAWLRASGEARRELELQTFPRAPFAIDGYSVDVQALEPFPYSNVRIDPRGYVATLVVSPR
jgi:hypothetical protein